MKARLATLASFAGVLVAGSAAAMVNSQVLHGTAVPKNSVRNVAPLSTPSSSPSGSGSTATTIVGSSTDSTSPSTQARYLVSGAGWVVLDTADGTLRVVKSGVNHGWKIVTEQQPDAHNLLISFRQGDDVHGYTEIDFHAGVLFGIVTTSVSKAEVQPGSTTTEGDGGTVVTTSPSTQPTDPTGPTRPPVTQPTVVPTTEPHHDGGGGGTPTTPPPPRTTQPDDDHHSGGGGFGGGGTPTSTTQPWGPGNGRDD